MENRCSSLKRGDIIISPQRMKFINHGILFVTEEGKSDSLDEDRTVRINDTNRLVIRDGSAQMEWADCPDQICVHHRAIHAGGENIICLPNKVVVSVISPEESGLDGIAQ